MKKYLLITHGTSQKEIEANRFYFQNDFIWFVDGAGTVIYSRDSKEISSVELM
jgi:hypothetical protein